MNKQELLKDLTILQARRHKILGAIEYILGKLEEIEKAELKDKEEEK